MFFSVMWILEKHTATVSSEFICLKAKYVSPPVEYEKEHIKGFTVLRSKKDR